MGYFDFNSWASATRQVPGWENATNDELVREWSARTGSPAPEKKEPGLVDQLKSGWRQTMTAGEAGLSTDPETIGRMAAKSQAEALPPTDTQNRMQAEIRPAQEAYDAASGKDAVMPFLSMFAQRAAQFAKNPREFAGLVAQNLPNSVPGMAGSIAGAMAGGATPIPGGAIVGGVAGGIVGGVGIERGNKLIEQVVEEAKNRGLDPTKPENLIPIARERYDDMSSRANKKGLGTAGIDAIMNVFTFGVAGRGGRILSSEAKALADGVKAGTVSAAEAAAKAGSIAERQAARSTTGAKVARGSGVAAGEMAGEGLSEAGGQYWADGKVNVLEAIDESLLGFGQGAAMGVGSGLVGRMLGTHAEGDGSAAVASANASAKLAAENAATRIQAEGEAKVAGIMSATSVADIVAAASGSSPTNIETPAYVRAGRDGQIPGIDRLLSQGEEIKAATGQSVQMPGADIGDTTTRAGELFLRNLEQVSPRAYAAMLSAGQWLTNGGDRATIARSVVENFNNPNYWAQVNSAVGADMPVLTQAAYAAMRMAQKQEPALRPGVGRVKDAATIAAEGAGANVPTGNIEAAPGMPYGDQVEAQTAAQRLGANNFAATETARGTVLQPADTAGDQQAVETLKAAITTDTTETSQGVVQTGARDSLRAVSDATLPGISLARSIAQKLGRRVVVVDSAGDTAPFNGVSLAALPDVLFIHAKTKRPAVAIIGHELLHSLSPELRARLMKALGPMISRAKVEAKMKDGLSEAHALEEVVADLVGNRFTEASFWRMLEKRDPGMFREFARRAIEVLTRVLQAMKQGLGLFGADEGMSASQLRKARDVIADAIVAHARGYDKMDPGMAEALAAARTVMNVPLLGYEQGNRGQKPVVVDAQGRAKQDGQSTVAEDEPQAKVIGRAAVEMPPKEEPKRIGYEPGARGQQPIIAGRQVSDEPAARVIGRAAVEVDTNPTDAQKEAGNHKKGHIVHEGLPMTIETEAGQARTGKDKSGKPWSVTMTADYGYVKRTIGADGEQVDAYLVPNPLPGAPVFVFDQYDGKKFDEHKAVIGVATRENAQAVYDAHFSDGSGPKRRKGVRRMSMDEFKTWLKGDTTKPVATPGSVFYSGDKSANGQQDEAKPAEVAATLNIGLSTKEVLGDGDRTVDDVIAEIKKLPDLNVVSHVVHQSDTEKTAVVEIDRELTKAEGDALSSALDQEAIVQRKADGSGDLFGPKAENWGPYNPEYFVMPDGKRASEQDAPRYSKDKTDLYEGNIKPRRSDMNMNWIMESPIESRRVLKLPSFAESKTVTKRQFGEAIDAFRAGKVAPDDYSTSAINKLSAALADEVEWYAENAKDSGIDWYSEKFPRSIDQLSKTIMSLKKKENRQLFTLLLAITSDGTDVQQNTGHAMDMYLGYMDGESLWSMAPGGKYEDSFTKNAMLIDALIKDRGIKDTMKFLLEPVTVAEIRAEMREAGFENPASDYPGTAVLPRSAVYLGPKLGAFFANLSGQGNYLTMDRWWSRTINRYRGNMAPEVSDAVVARFRELSDSRTLGFDAMVRKAKSIYLARSKKMKAESDQGRVYKQTELEAASARFYEQAASELNDSPRNSKDREFQIAVAQKAIDILGRRGVDTDIAGVQATIWYYEKELFEKIGVKGRKRISYEEAAFNWAVQYRSGQYERPTPRRGERAISKPIVEDGQSVLFSAERPGVDGLEPTSRREPVDGAVSVPGVHYSKKPGLNTLAGSQWGTGLGGAERERLATSSDHRIKNRVYFYVEKNERGDMPAVEAGVGPHRYDAYLGNMYDPSKGTISAPDGNSFESAVLDAGYDGYVVRDMGMAVVLNSDVPARYAGITQTGAKAYVPPADKSVKIGLLSKEIAKAESMMDEIKAIDPDAKIASGSLVVSAEAEGKVRDLIGVKSLYDTPKYSRDFGEMDEYDDTADAFTLDLEQDDNLTRSKIIPTEADRHAARRWLQMAQDKSMFTYPVSDEKSLENIAFDTNKLRATGWRPADQIERITGATKTAIITLPSRAGEAAKAHVHEDGKKNVWLNAVLLNRGAQEGSPVYQIVANYAHNNGKMFIGDPAGLSDNAVYRRTEQMLASALKFGTTDHIAPHERQKDAGLAWRKGDTEYNIAAMLAWSRTVVNESIPALSEVSYDPRTGQLLDAAGDAVDRKRMNEILDQAGAQDTVRAGTRTAARTVATNHFVDEYESGQADEPGLPEQMRKVSYSKDQTETPEFKRWFGDSKVVDDQGRPLVVYHGTISNNNFAIFKSGVDGAGWFAKDPAVADDFSQMDSDSTVYPVYLSLQNPLDARSSRSIWNKVFDPASSETIAEQLSIHGYDGLIADEGNGRTTYLAFRQAQIKSAIGNSGQFDANNPDIRYSSDQDKLGSARARLKDAGLWVRKISSDLWEFGYAVSDVGMDGIEVGHLSGDKKKELFAIRVAMEVAGQTRKRSRDFGLTNASIEARNYMEFRGVRLIDNKDGSWSLADSMRTFATFEAYSENNAYVKAIGVMHDYRQAQEDTQRAGGVPLFSAEPTDFIARLRGHAMDRIETQKTFSAWNSTVGTQYAKAKRDADFARVYDKVQEFFDSTNYMASEASDRAPTILPKLHSFSDAFRGITTDRTRDKNIRAASKVIFDGTLEDRVYKDAELKERGLNDDQIAIYREFRRATNKSLDQLGSSEIQRLMRGTGLKIGMDATAEDAATQAVMSILAVNNTSSIDDLSTQDKDRATTAKEIADRIRGLKATGYAPLMRFGRYTLDFKMEDERVFMMFEKESDRNKFVRENAAKAEAMKPGILSELEYQLFQGMSPDSLELFGDLTSIDAVDAEGKPVTVKLSDTEVYQKYLKTAIANKSALRRLIKREGVAGYAEDGGRILAQFITSNARKASRNLHMLDMATAASEIDKAKGDVKDEAIKLVKYIQDPQEEAVKLRGLMFANFLGGSIASAMVNLTQPVMMAFPYLSQWGAGKAASALTYGFKVALSGKAEGPLKDAMKRADETGLVEPHEIHHLYAEADRQVGANIYLRRLMRVWGGAFSAAEAFNRRSTFAAAYDIASKMSAEELEKAGAKDVYDFARQAVQETQGTMNKGNKPNWARGAMGGTLMTFKQYSIHYLEFFGRLPTEQKAIALGLLVLAAGLQGLPFADDLDDLIDTLGQNAGYNTNSKLWKRQAIASVVGDDVAKIMMQGVSGVAGMPIDVGRLGMGNLLPGTAALKLSNTNPERDVAELAGPAGSMLAGWVKAGKEILTGDVAGIEHAYPVALANMLKASDMADLGVYRDKSGKTVTKTDLGDAFVKLIGFQPNVVAQTQKSSQLAAEMINLVKVRERRIADKWAEGKFTNDEAMVKSAMDDLRAWNLANPDARIKISPSQISSRVKQMNMTKEQRMAKTAPKEIRAEVKRMLETSQ